MIKSLNTVRFMLMMMIFLHHVGLYSGGGSLAVAAFFILSGFCLSLGYGEKVKQVDFDYWGYLKKRLIKFYPLHWICLAAFVILGLFLLLDYKISLRPLLANVLLLQSWVPLQDFYFSYNAVSWYLCDAVFLAVIFPILYSAIDKMTSNQKEKLLLLMIVVYMAFVVFVPGGPMRKALLYINPLGRCFEFIVGIMTYHLYKSLLVRHVRIGGGDALFVISVAVMIVVSVINKRHTIGIGYWLPIVVMILCAALNDAYRNNSIMDRIMRHPICQWIAQCTMSFFMIHFIVVSYWHEIYCYSIETFLLSYGLAQISYYLIEKKLNRWIQAKI